MLIYNLLNLNNIFIDLKVGSKKGKIFISGTGFALNKVVLKKAK